MEQLAEEKSSGGPVDQKVIKLKWRRVLATTAITHGIAFGVGAPTAVAGARNTIPGSRFLSTRAAGMGDAYLTLADDASTGLFINPAGLASARPMNAEAINLTVEANNDFVMGANLNSYKVTSLPAYYPTLSDGEYPMVGFSFLPNFFGGGFAFGALLQSRISASTSSGTVNYRSSYQFIPAFGVGMRLASGMFRIGYSLQYVNKADGEVTGLPTTTSPMGYNQQLASGSGISHTAGVTLAIPVTYLPTLSVVARNVLGTSYSDFTILPLGRNSSGVPSTEAMSIDAAFSIQPRFQGGGFMNWVFQVKDLTSTSGFGILDRSALGAEFNFKGMFALRAGYALRDVQAGLGFKTSRADVQISWNTEELGTPAASVRDRRWLFQYSVKAF